ncbi:d-erythro-sphingosine kinase, partial [Genlisea aurea]
IRFNGDVTTATFSADGQLSWPGHRLLIEKQVLGFSIQGLKIHVRAVVESATATCFSCCAKSKLIRKTFTLQTLSDDSLDVWVQKLRGYLDSLGRPKRLFVLVNPYGGKKSALRIFVNDVMPLLDDACVEYTVKETAYRLHAKEMAQSLDLANYDGIVCVSGDGILVEVLNGLLVREDWHKAIKIPLGIVPAGSGNGMAKSLLYASGEPCSPSHATLCIIRGHKRSLDIATVAQGETKFFSMLMMAWGLVADIDIESERYRWMGGIRFDFYGLQRILSLRRYDGSILFVPAAGYESFGEPLDFENQILIEEIIKSGDEVGYQGPEFDSKSLNWRKIDGPFISVWLHNVPWGSETTMAAPSAEFSDGYIDLVLIKDCPKLPLLMLMTAMNSGGHVKFPYVSYLKVKAFVLEPGARTDAPEKEGIIDVDGEVLARGRGSYRYENGGAVMRYGKVVVRVDQGLATLFAP